MNNVLHVAQIVTKWPIGLECGGIKNVPHFGCAKGQLISE